MQRISLNDFDRLVEKAGLPREIVLDTVKETVHGFLDAWKSLRDGLPLLESHSALIEAHMKSLGLTTVHRKLL